MPHVLQELPESAPPLIHRTHLRRVVGRLGAVAELERILIDILRTGVRGSHRGAAGKFFQRPPDKVQAQHLGFEHREEDEQRYRGAEGVEREQMRKRRREEAAAREDAPDGDEPREEEHDGHADGLGSDDVPNQGLDRAEDLLPGGLDAHRQLRAGGAAVGCALELCQRLRSSGLRDAFLDRAILQVEQELLDVLPEPPRAAGARAAGAALSGGALEQEAQFAITAEGIRRCGGASRGLCCLLGPSGLPIRVSGCQGDWRGASSDGMQQHLRCAVGLEVGEDHGAIRQLLRREKCQQLLEVLRAALRVPRRLRSPQRVAHEDIRVLAVDGGADRRQREARGQDERPEHEWICAPGTDVILHGLLWPIEGVAQPFQPLLVPAILLGPQQEVVDENVERLRGSNGHEDHDLEAVAAAIQLVDRAEEVPLLRDLRGHLRIRGWDVLAVANIGAPIQAEVKILDLIADVREPGHLLHDAREGVVAGDAIDAIEPMVFQAAARPRGVVVPELAGQLLQPQAGGAEVDVLLEAVSHGAELADHGLAGVRLVDEEALHRLHDPLLTVDRHDEQRDDGEYRGEHQLQLGHFERLVDCLHEQRESDAAEAKLGARGSVLALASQSVPGQEVRQDGLVATRATVLLLQELDILQIEGGWQEEQE
mmetsp:Transcript_86524/g.279238  ORF Transcript_86524/g.279238 Transcript_86524/m.279238 type:complete len:654 (-) Transcript_86524:939-2900(-)